MEEMHGQTDLINLDKYIADCVRNEINEEFSIVIDTHGNEVYYDNLMSWLNARGYKWYSGDSLFKEVYHRAIAISIYPKDGYVMFYSSLNDDEIVNIKYFLDYEDIDFELDYKSNEQPKTITVDFSSTEQKQQIVYISGAISGTTDYLERFENAETELTVSAFLF